MMTGDEYMDSAEWSVRRVKSAAALWIRVDGVGRRRGRVPLMAPPRGLEKSFADLGAALLRLVAWCDQLLADAKVIGADAAGAVAWELSGTECAITKVNATVHALARGAAWATAERLESEMRVLFVEIERTIKGRLTKVENAKVIPLRSESAEVTP